jgi:hypothetical protein
MNGAGSGGIGFVVASVPVLLVIVVAVAALLVGAWVLFR